MDPVASYHAFTAAVAVSAGSDKLAHVDAGLLIFVGMQALLRGRRASLPALAMVLILALANEIFDRLYCGSWRWRDSLGDVAATLFWPACLWWLARCRRAQWRRQKLQTSRTLARPSPLQPA